MSLCSCVVVTSWGARPEHGRTFVKMVLAFIGAKRVAEPRATSAVLNEAAPFAPPWSQPNKTNALICSRFVATSSENNVVYQIGHAIAALMSATESPKKPKKSIHEYFKRNPKTYAPHQSTIPAKRPSPSIEESRQYEKSHIDESKLGTPKTGKRKLGDAVFKTPGSSARSPFSTPGSRASLSIRRKAVHAEPPIKPPSIYKQASIFSPRSQSHSVFSSPTSKTPTPKPETKSFSFADLPSSHQAVLIDGKVIEILDSDLDETSSLESLEDFFDKRKTDHSTSLSSTPGGDEEKLEAERVKTLSFFTSGSRQPPPIIGRDKLRELRAKENAVKFNVGSLLIDHFDDEEVENNVRKARADVEAATRAAEAENNPTLDKTLLAAVAATEDGDHAVARLMDAVDRTEALTSEQVFSFFGANGLNDWEDKGPVQSPFPKDSIPADLWQEGDNESRSRAYLSVYVADLAAAGQVPDEALNWTFENLVLERSDELRQAYADCLWSANSTWTRTNITAQRVQNIFQSLGADSNSLRDSVEIKPRHRLPKEPPRRDPKYLLSALDAFSAICSEMDFLALSKLASMLCRMAIDTELMSDGQISGQVEELLETLLLLPEIEMRTHVAERILDDMGRNLKDPSLQANLLSHVLPKSPISTKLRIVLAHEFLFGDSKPKKSTLSLPKISLEVLTNHVSTSPDFDTKRRKGTHTIDYIALRARTQILDTAISNGGRPPVFPSHVDEQTFNKSVDHLADAVQSTQIAINDPGASHMTRTEAKNDLQALHARLLFSVRTEERPRRHIFDGKLLREAGEVKSEEQSKDFMKKFLERRKGRRLRRVRKQEVGDLGASREEKLPVSSGSSSEMSGERSDTEKAIRKQLRL